MEKEQLLKMKIDDLEISKRLRNRLKRGGINTLEELLKKEKEELMSIKNYGMSCWAETITLVHSLGLKFIFEEKREELTLSKEMSDSDNLINKKDLIHQKYNQLNNLLKERKELLIQEKEIDKRISQILNSIIKDDLQLKTVLAILENNGIYLKYQENDRSLESLNKQDEVKQTKKQYTKPKK